MSSTWLHPNSFSRSLHKARICCTLHRALLFYNKTWTNRFYFPAFSWRHTFSAGVFSGSLLPTAAAEGWLFPQNWQTAWTNSFKLSFLTCFFWPLKLGFYVKEEYAEGSGECLTALNQGLVPALFSATGMLWKSLGQMDLGFLFRLHEHTFKIFLI